MIKKTGEENAYIGIAVHALADFKFIENLNVIVTVLDKNGTTIGKLTHHYHPRPGLHHYGKNWILPGDGEYTIRVSVDSLDLKWDETIKDYLSPGIIEVEFPQVKIITGQHIS